MVHKAAICCIIPVLPARIKSPISTNVTQRPGYIEEEEEEEAKRDERNRPSDR